MGLALTLIGVGILCVYEGIVRLTAPRASSKPDYEAERARRIVLLNRKGDED